MNFFARLATFQRKGESLHAYAKRLGIAYTSIRLYKGGGTPGAKKAAELAEKIGVNPGWLLFGGGDENAN